MFIVKLKVKKEMILNIVFKSKKMNQIIYKYKKMFERKSKKYYYQVF